MDAICSDGELGYEVQRTRFEAGKVLLLDENYRLAHLPLVAPGHPKVISAKPGRPYDMGRHEAVTSLVLPVPHDLYESAVFLELVDDLRMAPFGAKVAWHVLEARRFRLHATLCGSLASGGHAQVLDQDQRARLADLGAIWIELRGLFSGSVNLGRLYLKTYPERIGSENAIKQIQNAIGCRTTDLYPVGLFNLLDDLGVDETRALAALIDRWWDRPIVRFRADRLWLLSARDDLVLDGDVAEIISLT